MSWVIAFLVCLAIFLAIGLVMGLITKWKYKLNAKESEKITENELKFLHTMRYLGVEEDPLNYLVRNTEKGKFEWKANLSPLGNYKEFYLLNVLDGINFFGVRARVREEEGEVIYSLLCASDDKKRFEWEWAPSYFENLSNPELSRGDPRVKKLLDCLVEKVKTPM